MPVPLKVKGIGASRYKSEKFALTAFYMQGLNWEDLEVYVYINCKLHLIKSLKANILIGNDVFYTKGFKINLTSASAHILSCEITIVINARNHLEFLIHNMLANLTTFILPKSKIFVIF